MIEYTPQRVAAILRGHSTDPDELADVFSAVDKLGDTPRKLLCLYAFGYSPRTALGLLNVIGNAQRMYERALRTVTALLNGAGTKPNTTTETDTGTEVAA